MLKAKRRKNQKVEAEYIRLAVPYYEINMGGAILDGMKGGHSYAVA